MHSKEDYEKLESIVNDTRQNEEINVNKKRHPIIAKEGYIAYYIRKHFKGYDEKLMRKLAPSCNSPGKIYGLVKVHKKDNRLRRVVSIIGTLKYELAKFFDMIIKPYISYNMLDSTSDFISKLNQRQFS